MRGKKLEYIRQYLKRRKVMGDARRWVKANDERVLARCMYHLNHLAGTLFRSERRETIYALKSVLVQSLYEQGFCVSVRIHIQKLECWHTEGYNSGYYDECPKCYNTGVYASHRLYQFVFNIYGQRFVWHQPASLVDFPIPPLAYGEPTPYKPARREIERITREQERLYLATVYQYLRSVGVSANDLPQFTLRGAVKRQWHWSVIDRWRRVKWHYRYYNQPRIEIYLKNFYRLWEFIKTGEMPKQILEEDEIPF